MEPLLSWHHIEAFMSGATFLGIVSHAVNTFPPPDNQYGKWLLGTVQYVVGQRTQAKETKLTETQQMKASNGQ